VASPEWAEKKKTINIYCSFKIISFFLRYRYQPIYVCIVEDRTILRYHGTRGSVTTLFRVTQRNPVQSPAVHWEELERHYSPLKWWPLDVIWTRTRQGKSMGEAPSLVVRPTDTHGPWYPPGSTHRCDAGFLDLEAIGDAMQGTRNSWKYSPMWCRVLRPGSIQWCDARSPRQGLSLFSGSFLPLGGDDCRGSNHSPVPRHAWLRDNTFPCHAAEPGSIPGCALRGIRETLQSSKTNHMFYTTYLTADTQKSWKNCVRSSLFFRELKVLVTLRSKSRFDPFECMYVEPLITLLSDMNLDDPFYLSRWPF